MIIICLLVWPATYLGMNKKTGKDMTKPRFALGYVLSVLLSLALRYFLCIINPDIYALSSGIDIIISLCGSIIVYQILSYAPLNGKK